MQKAAEQFSTWRSSHMWQAAALILGTRPLSQAEFEAIMARLERSCRTFEMGPTSRNYAAMLRRTLSQAFEPGPDRLTQFH